MIGFFRSPKFQSTAVAMVGIATGVYIYRPLLQEAAKRQREEQQLRISEEQRLKGSENPPGKLA